jgi:ribosomal-protein-serine acetyltransferase
MLRFDKGQPVMLPDIPTEIPSVLLRFLKEEDAGELSLLIDQNHEYLRKWLPWVSESSNPSHELEFINACSRQAAAAREFHYAILVDREIAGIVSFNLIQKNNRCATLGYWLAKPHTGRGIMTSAVKALVATGFEYLGLNRIQAGVATDNYPSQAVCDRNGFTKEGVLRQGEWLHDHYVDITINGLLKAEWKT